MWFPWIDTLNPLPCICVVQKITTINNKHRYCLQRSRLRNQRIIKKNCLVFRPVDLSFRIRRHEGTAVISLPHDTFSLTFLKLTLPFSFRLQVDVVTSWLPRWARGEAPHQHQSLKRQFYTRKRSFFVHLKRKTLKTSDSTAHTKVKNTFKMCLGLITFKVNKNDMFICWGGR